MTLLGVLTKVSIHLRAGIEVLLLVEGSLLIAYPDEGGGTFGKVDCVDETLAHTVVVCDDETVLEAVLGLNLFEPGELSNDITLDDSLLED